MDPSCRSVAADKLLPEETVCAKLSPLRISWEPSFLAFQGLQKELKLIGGKHSDFLRSFKSKALMFL